jgi:asparagine synthase (glutamine-hydrolysing)
MCGLVAIWRPGGAGAAEVDVALDAMAYRGPDARAVASLDGGRLALGHLRLSILDLSAAASQPMASADGRWTIAYNGEVVNFRRLRPGMCPPAGWRSDSDTEVLLEGFAARGEAMLHDCVGMFAFAVHDRDGHALHLVRDRFGIKPLYFARLGDGGLVAASEIPALLALPDVPRQPDEDTIRTYLETGLYDATPRTFFRGIESLPPGCSARLDLRDGSLRISRWYDFPAAVRRRAIGAGHDWLAGARSLVEQAVTEHLVADVPVGLNVSGGVDSSVLCALAARTIPDLHVFTQDHEPPYSERDWARRAAGGARLHVASLSEAGIRQALPDALRRQAEPFGGVPVIGYDPLYRTAAEAGVVVLLDGNGVDESFLGYGKYRALAEGRIRPDDAVSIDGTVATAVAAIDPALRRRADLLAVPGYAEAFDHPVRAAAARDLLHAKIPRGLRFNDRMSMARSRELRVPFLDHRLVEFAYTVPVPRLISGDVTKLLFREMAAELVGEELAFARKREVQTPQREWLAAAWAPMVEGILESPAFAARGWIDPVRAREIFRRYRGGERTNSFPIWQWVNLELWAREHFGA